MSDTTIEAAPRVDGLAIGAAVVTVLLWAPAFVGIRDAGSEISAGPLSLGRRLVASVFLGLLVAAPPRGAAAARGRAASHALQPALVRRLLNRRGRARRCARRGCRLRGRRRRTEALLDRSSALQITFLACAIAAVV